MMSLTPSVICTISSENIPPSSGKDRAIGEANQEIGSSVIGSTSLNRTFILFSPTTGFFSRSMVTWAQAMTPISSDSSIAVSTIRDLIRIVPGVSDQILRNIPPSNIL